MIPAILDHQGPVVVLDVKGENFAVTRRHRQSLGRKVAVLYPFGIIEDTRDQFNPLDYIRPNELTRDVSLVADGLVKPEDGDGAHFSEMARQLVAAAIEVIITQEKPERRNLIAVADLLLAGDLDAILEAWAALRVVFHVTQEFALVQCQGQADLVMRQPGDVTWVHPSRLPWAGAGFAVSAHARIEDRPQGQTNGKC